MTDHSALHSAIRGSMQTEKDAMDFYLHAAEKMSEPGAKEVFRFLAREERQHACSFFVIYRGSDIPSFENFLETPPNTASEWWKCLDRLGECGFDEGRAYAMALELEEDLEQKLRATAASIEDDEVRAIYLANANSTHKHHQMIAERYQALQNRAPGE